MALLVDEGAKVHAGQPLARLDTTLANAQIQAAQANVAEAASNALRAKDEWQRAESIRSSGALSDEAIDQRHAASVAADARLAAARAQQQEVNARMQGGYVRAPVSGTVISRSVQLGAMVDQQEMFRIAGGDALEVSSQIGEQDVLSLQLGQNASFRLVDGTTETGTLTRSPASINSRTRTGEALFDLPSNTRVKAGMFLRGEASLSSRNAMSAPQSSVLYDNGQPYVFVVDASRHAHKTILRLGLREGDSVEVLSGLQPGARIVGAGAAFIQDGDIVRPIEAPRAAAAPQIRGDIEDLPQLRGRSDG
jgi:RND family efflux transporter MFP subunit